jgi:hypothetical protein
MRAAGLVVSGPHTMMDVVTQDALPCPGYLMSFDGLHMLMPVKYIGREAA